MPTDHNKLVWPDLARKLIAFILSALLLQLHSSLDLSISLLHIFPTNMIFWRSLLMLPMFHCQYHLLCTSLHWNPTLTCPQSCHQNGVDTSTTGSSMLANFQLIPSFYLHQQRPHGVINKIFMPANVLGCVHRRKDRQWWCMPWISMWSSDVFRKGNDSTWSRRNETMPIIMYVGLTMIC